MVPFGNSKQRRANCTGQVKEGFSSSHGLITTWNPSFNKFIFTRFHVIWRSAARLVVLSLPRDQMSLIFLSFHWKDVPYCLFIPLYFFLPTSLPSFPFLPGLFCGLFLVLPSQSLQPTCTLLVRCRHSPPLSRTKVGSPRSWVSTCGPNPGSTCSSVSHCGKATPEFPYRWEWTCQQGCCWF